MNIVECPACGEAFFKSSFTPAPTQAMKPWYKSGTRSMLCPGCSTQLKSKYQMGNIGNFVLYATLISLPVIRSSELIAQPFGDTIFFSLCGIFITYLITRAVQESKDSSPFVVVSSTSAGQAKRKEGGVI